MENHCRAHQYDQNLLKGPYAHFHLHIFLILGLCRSSFVWFPVQNNLYLSHSGIRCSPSEHHLCRENSVLALFPLCCLFVFWLAAPLHQNVGGASDTGPKKRENRGKNCKLSETFSPQGSLVQTLTSLFKTVAMLNKIIDHWNRINMTTNKKKPTKSTKVPL